MLGTAKLNRLDPVAWLRDTLGKLPTSLTVVSTNYYRLYVRLRTLKHWTRMMGSW
ncbi:MAG: transposase domain-containing protein [Methylococcaceae bacterium]